jgi:hypothetical protein
VIARVRPAFFSNGVSPIYTDEQVHGTLKNLHPRTIACEYYMDPTLKAQNEGFDEKWLQYHSGLSPEELNACNLYIVVDPGKGKEKNSHAGKTAMLVIALHPNRKYYLIDGIRIGMNLEQRTDWLFSFHRMYAQQGRMVKVGYESYALQSDVEHMRLEQERQGYFFPISALHKKIDKDERISALIPVFKNSEFVLPRFIPKRVVGGVETDFMDGFIREEYARWPATKNKDALDAMAWILHRMEEGADLWIPAFPAPAFSGDGSKQIDWDQGGGMGSWMAA